ncbi:MAG: DUF6088 family protein [Methanocorpusculum sp.]|nr:DUF6088 family protein [Methanocorpusculum sp.]
MIKENTYTEQIKKRIKDKGAGEIFVISDFLDIAPYQTIKQILARLTADNLLRRIIDGVYEYPRYSEFLEEYASPSVDKIAEALARNNGWTIAPSGDTALNRLGLSTQVPASWVYVTNGSNREYSVGKIKIRFKKTANKELSTGMSRKTALVIQALKSTGRKNITGKTIERISSKLNDEDKFKALAETQYTTRWIYEVIKQICNTGLSNAEYCKTSS